MVSTRTRPHARIATIDRTAGEDPTWRLEEWIGSELAAHACRELLDPTARVLCTNCTEAWQPLESPNATSRCLATDEQGMMRREEEERT